MSSPVRVERPSNLALDSAKPKGKVTFNEASISSQKINPCAPLAPQRKLRNDTEFRNRRKRAHSCSFPWDHLNAKRRRSGSTIVLPTKFLLGGNITDPLNLEALDKGDYNKNEEEQLSCKRGSTVRVIIPPNINDPLNLDACSEDGDEQLADAILRQRRRRKTRKRKRRNSEPGGLTYESVMDKRLSTSFDEELPSPLIPIRAVSQPPVTPEKIEIESPAQFHRQISEPANLQQTKEILLSPSVQQPTNRIAAAKKPRPKVENKIVSPVVPQPGVERKRHSSYQRQSSEKTVNLSHSNLKPPEKFNPKNSQFQYGNYNQYYGYRNPEHKADPRLKYLKKEWFEGKEILDVGCNIGHITITIGRDFCPRRVVGIDIDKKLVNIAKKNIKHYLLESSSAELEFPKAMKLLYGPLKPPLGKDGMRKFPHNVSFCQANYVMENDALLETVRPEFDVVLCLSVTKWIHLNWGDDGLKRFFKRIFRNLRPGGILVFEPQAWPSYTKKRKLTAQIFENYRSIRLLPDKFGEFLTKEVGFTFGKKITVSQHFSRGFQRPMFIYKKISQERKEETGRSESMQANIPFEFFTNSSCKQKNDLSSTSLDLTSSESTLSSSSTLSSESAGLLTGNAPDAIKSHVIEPTGSINLENKSFSVKYVTGTVKSGTVPVENVANKTESDTDPVNSVADKTKNVKDSVKIVEETTKSDTNPVKSVAISTKRDTESVKCVADKTKNITDKVKSEINSFKNVEDSTISDTDTVNSVTDGIPTEKSKMDCHSSDNTTKNVVVEVPNKESSPPTEQLTPPEKLVEEIKEADIRAPSSSEFKNELNSFLSSASSSQLKITP